MCSRYAFAVMWDVLAGKYKVTVPNNLKPNYNAAPTQRMGIITQDAPQAVQVASFGLVPPWSKDGKTSYSMINARSETLTEKPTYKRLIANNRCVVPATGYFEWKHVGKEKQPYYIQTKEEIFFFAGLWSDWTDPESGESKRTYSIITTEPNDKLKGVHDRMPCILDSKTYGRWLATADLDLLRPYPETKMRFHRVDEAIGNVRNNRPELLAPVV